MKKLLVAKELLNNVYCFDCGKLLSCEMQVTIFQNEYGEDLLDGYYCDECALKYDELGQSHL